MHALKNYSDSSYSDDDEYSKKVKKRTHEDLRKKHGKNYDRPQKRDHSETYERIKHSPSKYSKEFKDSDRSAKDSHGDKEYKRSDRSFKASYTGKESSKRSKTSHGDKDYYSDKKKSLYTSSSRRDRSRSRSPDRRKLSDQSHKYSSKAKEPETKEPEISAIPALAQAQAASALLSARLGHASQAQLQLNKAKQESIEEKRKKLWSSKKKTPTSQSQWEQATFSEGDSQMQAKFRRLMGMSSASKEKIDTKDISEDTGGDHKESTDVMKNLEQQYESSRYLTHMARGYGLGYGYSSTSDSADVNK